MKSWRPRWRDREEAVSADRADGRAADPVVERERTEPVPTFLTATLECTRAARELAAHLLTSDRAGPRRAELESLAEDADALHEALRTAELEGDGPARADLHSRCERWQPVLDRIETLARTIDADYHRRWRAENLTALLGRSRARPWAGRVPLPDRP